MTVPYFRFTCPNPKCAILIGSLMVRGNCCPECGCCLLPSARDLREAKAA